MESILDKLRDAKKEHDIANISFFNDGKIRKDEVYSAKRINNINDKDQFEAIERVLYNATSSYARNYEFDNIDMDLLFGLVFDSKDIDENDMIKEDAEPIQGIVRYYTSSITSTLNNKKTNIMDYNDIGAGRQGYANYNKLISLIKESGLDFNGPDTFKEFEEQILIGEPFNINVSASFKEKEDTNNKEAVKTR